MNTEIDRKIAVIFVADVVGYSKHMEKNENATITSYNACETILNKLLKKYKGSVFNTAGDSVLAEFPSAVNAVECGVDFQNEIKKRNQSDKTDVKLEFRLGINMGDVVKKDNNLIGDGVNIAARLEALAQPNGISISKSVYDFVVPKTKMSFNDLGVQKVKQNEFHAFDILLDPSQKRTLKTKAKSKMPLIGAIVAAIIIAFVGMFYFTTKTPQKAEAPNLKISSKPTVLVSSINASGLSQDQQGFANGVTESMISAISNYKGIKVLSFSVSEKVKNEKTSDLKLKTQYGIRYVVSGNIQVMGENARINLEVNDLDLGEVIGTEKRDFSLNDIFKVQDEISQKILLKMSVEAGLGVDKNFVSKYFKSLDDYTMFLNWRRELKKGTVKGYNQSKKMLEKIREKSGDDEHGLLFNMQAWQLWQKHFLLGDKHKATFKEDMQKISEYVNKAIESSPERSFYHSGKAFLLGVMRRDCEAALRDISKAESLGFQTDDLQLAAFVFNGCGNVEKAISLNYQFLDVSPSDQNWAITGHQALLLYKTGRIEEVLSLVGDNINATDMDGRVLAVYALMELDQGNVEKANYFLTRALENGITVNRMATTLGRNEFAKKSLKALKELNPSFQ